MKRTAALYILLISLFVSSLYAQDSYTSYDSLQILLTKGGKNLYDKNYDIAEASFLAAYEMAPDNFDVLKNLGVIYSAVGQMPKAKEFFFKALAIKPKDHSLLNNIGVLYNEVGDYNEAVTYFRQAIIADSSLALYHTNLGQALMRLGKYDESINALSKAENIEPANNIVWYSLANAYAANKNYSQAEKYYEKCVQADVKSEKLYYFTGIVKMRLGKNDEAVSFLKKSLEFQPNNLPARQSIGLIYFDDKDYEAAIEQFQKIIDTDTTFNQAKISLGASYALMGQHELADSILFELFRTDSTLGFSMMDIIRQRKLQDKK